MASTAPATTPPDDTTKDGYIFLYVHIPMLALATAIVGFRVWWRFVNKGSLNRADVCIVISLVREIRRANLINLTLTSG